MKTRQTKADRDMDTTIERLYYKHAAGRTIDIMKIGALYRDAKSAHAAGLDLETAVRNAIAVYTQPA